MCDALNSSAIYDLIAQARRPDEILPEQVLRDIRGVDNVEEEFSDIKAAVERARLVVNPWRTILKPSYAPQLFIAITATLFQQVTHALHAAHTVRVLPEPGHPGHH